MPRQKTTLIQKVIKIKESQQEMLDTMTNKWGFMSESEVFRQALVYFYRKMEPEYLQPSVTQKEKEKQISEKERIENMSDEEFVREIAQAEILQDRNGVEYCVMHWWGNSLKAIRMDQVRHWLTERVTDAIDNHLNIAKSLPLRAEIEANRGWLRSTYDIIVPDDWKS